MKKVLFSIDVTNDKNSLYEEGREFITKEVDSFIKDQVDNLGNEVGDLEKEAILGKPLYYTTVLSKYFMIVIGILMLGGLINTPIDETYDNAEILFYVLPVFIITWGITAYIGKKKLKEKESEVEANNLNERMDSIVETVETELDIPKETISMDFIGFRYIVKNDEIKIKPKAMVTSVAVLMKVYIENDMLCIANIYAVHSIPLSEIMSIVKVEKTITTNNWTKDEGPMTKDFKDYKLRVNQFGMVMSKPYYIANILHDEQEFLLYIPKYEIKKFLEITNKTISE